MFGPISCARTAERGTGPQGRESKLVGRRPQVPASCLPLQALPIVLAVPKTLRMGKAAIETCCSELAGHVHALLAFACL